MSNEVQERSGQYQFDGIGQCTSGISEHDIGARIRDEPDPVILPIHIADFVQKIIRKEGKCAHEESRKEHEEVRPPQGKSEEVECIRRQSLENRIRQANHELRNKCSTYGEGGVKFPRFVDVDVKVITCGEKATGS